MTLKGFHFLIFWESIRVENWHVWAHLFLFGIHFTYCAIIPSDLYQVLHSLHGIEWIPSSIWVSFLHYPQTHCWGRAFAYHLSPAHLLFENHKTFLFFLSLYWIQSHISRGVTLFSFSFSLQNRFHTFLLVVKISVLRLRHLLHHWRSWF